MRQELHSEVSRRLLGDYGFKAQKDWLREGKCPECGKRELYTRADSPWILRCGRLAKCGAEIAIKDIYRDLFESWSDRYARTETNPNAAADAYLQFSRGFDVKRLRGLYTQETYHSREVNQTSATVRFALTCGSWWERIIDRPERFGKRKANFAYGKPYHGHWWELPDTAPDAEEIWLTEGVFDAYALELNGLSARGLLSSNNYPEHALAALLEQRKAAGLSRPTLIWALDGDASGRSFTKKWIERARSEAWDCKAAQIPQHGSGKIDWNDLHQRAKLTDKDRETYLYEGALLVAESPVAKALLMYQRLERKEFHFGFENRLFWFKLDLDRYEKARRALEDADKGLSEQEMREQALRESGGVIEIANCYPSALYYQANALTDESWYYYRVSFPHKGKPLKNTFTAGQLSSASEFKKRLLAIAPGAVFTGSTQQLDRIFKESLFSIKTVETIDYIGYSREHGCYVLSDLAVKDGNIYELNEEDFFEFGRLSVKTLNQSVSLSINRDRSDYRSDWVDMIWKCYGAKGLVALAFWFGSLFAEQIRAAQKSYPFLEIIGEAGSGKSTLVEFLWKLVGRRDYEGFDPSKSTIAARARNFAQVSGLPVVLIEGDRDSDTAKQKAFDWNELKTAYNGRSVRATGVKNSGNETREPPFRGSIVIAQNAEVMASDAILQRLVHLKFDKGAHTPETKKLAEELERMPVENVSGFILAATKREQKVMDILTERAGEYADQVLGLKEVSSVRIAKNHGQMMALVDALRVVVQLTNEHHSAAHDALKSMAAERQRAINADHPFVTAFWELFEHIDGNLNAESINHSNDATLVAINLIEFAERVAKRGLHLPVDLTELKKHLRTSRLRRFVDVKTVRSKVDQKTRKCWVFQHER
ncbi:toprim domain-containing protein [Lysobacter sp. CA199]|uniref:toprim domain-containing protein n=1 Tax=Lysobacter sp. CA199 TaxID=3455608 RepID=UPI003F8CF398